jgi:UDP-N-acetylmuramoyl-L-alanyl-D-glutamate--2,6-diaminopimelate ligase
MNLKDILYKVRIQSVSGSVDAVVSDLQIDSRKIKQGSLFIAVKGVQSDGHDFISQAVENGANIIVAEKIPAGIDENITCVQVADSAEAAG